MQVAALGAVLGASAPAWGQTIEFWVHNTDPNFKNPHVVCKGPFGRNSSCQQANVLPIEPRRKFYEAWVTAPFSAWGLWTCSLISNHPGVKGCDQDPIRVETIDFCMIPHDQDFEVNLNFDGTFHVDEPLAVGGGCDGVFAQGTLGSPGGPVSARVAGRGAARAARAGLDIDTYEFPATAGEELEIVLDRNGSAGGDGAIATLRVRDASGESIDEETGPLPLTLNVTAPSDDGILIAIESVDADDDEAFRGGYTLEVTSEGGSVGDRLTEPRTDVEN